MFYKSIKLTQIC